jgi:hypothetical protein
MTRIGRVKTAASGVRPDQVNLDMRCFHLIVEGGRVTLGCWIPIKEEGGNIIFERVS